MLNGEEIGKTEIKLFVITYGNMYYECFKPIPSQWNMKCICVSVCVMHDIQKVICMICIIKYV